MKLKISPTLSLPLDFVTQSAAILAKRGAGKSHTASVFAEELLKQEQQVVAIDPTGAWFGLKSSADGNSPGYSVVIFGGDHADVPLESTSGEVVARAIVEHRFSCVLDLSLFRKGESIRFLAAFLETLYRLNRLPLHLICDEADYYAPQRTFGDEARTLGAMQDIVRRGRKKGIGCTLISQRPASLNKDVLTQCEILIAMRLVHPRDIDAIEEWVAVHGDEKTAATMIASLPALPIGTAWIWSPGWGDLFEKVSIRARETFDSGATPKPGQVEKVMKRAAQIDLDKLGADIVQTVERAKQNDPKQLKAEIARLQQELAKKPVPVISSLAKVEYRDRAILSVEDRSLLERAIALFGKGESKFKLTMDRILEKTRHAASPAEPTFSLVSSFSRATPSEFLKMQAPKAERFAAHETTKANGLGAGHRKILTVLAQYSGGKETTTLAHLAGFTVAGYFKNILGSLRTAGFVSPAHQSPITITEEGRKILGNFVPLPTGIDLRNHWLQKCGAGEAKMLQVLFDAYPSAIPTAELAARAGFQVAGYFKNMLGHLRTIELVTGYGDVKASDSLFQDA